MKASIGTDTATENSVKQCNSGGGAIFGLPVVSHIWYIQMIIPLFPDQIKF
jgi:hypothetical protein